MSRKSLALAAALAAACTAALFCARTKTPFWYGHDATVEAAQVDASVFPFFSKWLTRSGSDPLNYIVDKCRSHQLVIVGEQHYIKDYCELFAKAIPEVYRKAGVRVVALEVCNAEDNDKIARLIEGPTYDVPLAYEIARSEDWELWGYKEYWDILEAAWALNRSLPAGQEHVRVVGNRLHARIVRLVEGQGQADEGGERLAHRRRVDPGTVTPDDAALLKLADALEHGRRGQADLGGDGRIRQVRVVLKQVQNFAVGVVECGHLCVVRGE